MGPYVADFLSYAARLIVEADGRGHDPSKELRRDEWFSADGWRVMRFSNEAILTDSLRVGRSIRSAIDGEGKRSKP